VRRVFTVLALCLGFGPGLASIAAETVPSTYSAGATFGTVVDPTGKPVEGAVVVAQWVTETGENGDRTGVLVVREAITDASGQFRIEAWGPIQRPGNRTLDRMDPEVIVVKPGGLFWAGSNYGLAAPGDRLGLEHRDWLRNGSTIRLQSVKANADEMDKQSPVYGIWSLLRQVIKSDDCKWTKVPRALASLEKDFGRVGRPSAEVRGSEFFARTDCGSLVEFRGAYEGMRDRP